MRSGTIAVAAGVALLLSYAGPATAAGSPAKSAAARLGASLPLGGVISDPDWLQKPTGDNLTELYPKLAGAMNLDGRTIMDCAVKASGELEGCRITAEAPLGVGFGYATLQAASRFRMKPMSINGATVAGARVQVPIGWRWGGDDAGAGAAPADATLAAVPETRMILARRIAQNAGSAAVYAKAIKYLVEDAERAQNEAGAVTHPTEHALALQSLRDAGREWAAQWTERVARITAVKLTEAELTQVAAFVESPAGRAWLGLGNALSEKETVELAHKLSRDAGVRFCQQVTCLTSAAETAKASGQP